jgi:hypothetical protein
MRPLQHFDDDPSQIDFGADWVRIRDARLRGIKSQAQQELKRIENLQTVEFNELFPRVNDTDSEEADQGTEDLNMTIASALASHAVPKSPADHASLRGYGDVIESTHLEKIGLNSRNLPGVRGLEAIQVSSHRGPPTDRPPDIPRNALGVFVGCSQERANTRHS